MPDAIHGTASGAWRHRKRGEKPCDSCLQAEREASRNRDKGRRVVGDNRAKLHSASKPPAPADALDAWRARAACAGLARLLDPPGRMDDDTKDRAVALCMSCPVRAQCLTWVLGVPDREDPGGIVAGFTEHERTRLRARGRGRGIHRTHLSRTTDQVGESA